MTKKRFYFISYLAAGNLRNGPTQGYCCAVIDKSPAAWSFKASSEHSDGPYVILYAEEISAAEYKRQEDLW